MTARRLRTLALALPLALGAPACARPVPVAGPEPVPSAGAEATPRPTRRQGDVLTLEEIRATPAVNVYQLLERTRPQYLRPVPGTSSRAAQRYLPYVFVNGSRWGPLESLRTMQPEHVVSIRRLSASSAQVRYGSDYVGGVLEIVTRDAPK